MNQKVVITGLGAVTPIGLNIEEYWQGLVAGRSGIGPITLFDPSPYPIKIAAEVKNFDPAKYMPLKRMDRTGRCTQFAIAAAKMALESARLDMSITDRDRMGVVIATTGVVSLNAEYGEIIKHRPMRIDPLFITRSGQCMVHSD